ncbi:anti-sigma factor [Horticoccus luteus]|uniref:Regulator of SigK n=1 Tax=Horticoccus luteus TaxID=2862869 RepID=A0A8F9TWK1_9BACT|nr:anti-sigma factor [Horticoccus luteus]QYM79377.1 anti-sigma factor [Horticoccus luteus]
MNEERTETASLYVLNLLEPEEARAFEQALRADPALAELVRKLEAGAATLAARVPPRTPPPRVREQVWAAIQASKPAPRKVPRVAWLGWWAAAAFAAIAVLLGVDRARVSRTPAVDPVATSLARLQVATLAPSAQGPAKGSAAVAWDQAQQRGVITVENLPDAGAGHDYQLWVIDPSYKVPVSAGVLAVTDGKAQSEFSTAKVIAAAQKFAISLEPKGGSATPTGAIVMIGP